MGQTLSDESMEKVIGLSKQVLGELRNDLKQGIFNKEKVDKSLHNDLSTREKFYKSKGVKMSVKEKLELIKKYKDIERQARRDLPQLFKEKVISKGKERVL